LRRSGTFAFLGFFPKIPEEKILLVSFLLTFKNEQNYKKIHSRISEITQKKSNCVSQKICQNFLEFKKNSDVCFIVDVSNLTNLNLNKENFEFDKRNLLA